MNAWISLQDIMPKVSEILKKKWGHLVIDANDLSVYQKALDDLLGSGSKNKIEVVAKTDKGLKLRTHSSSSAFWLKMNRSLVEKKLKSPIVQNR